MGTSDDKQINKRMKNRPISLIYKPFRYMKNCVIIFKNPLLAMENIKIYEKESIQTYFIIKQKLILLKIGVGMNLSLYTS